MPIAIGTSSEILTTYQTSSVPGTSDAEYCTYFDLTYWYVRYYFPYLVCSLSAILKQFLEQIRALERLFSRKLHLPSMV